jgi:hypothetical protein
MVSGKGLKRPFLTGYLPKKTNGTSVCGSASDATNGAGNAREKHNETYSRDLEELVNSPEVTRRVFGAKGAVKVHTGN